MHFQAARLPAREPLPNEPHLQTVPIGFYKLTLPLRCGVKLNQNPGQHFSLPHKKELHMIRSYLGHNPVIPSSCYVDISAQIVGQVELGEQASVWMNAVLGGEVHSIDLGACR